MNTKHNFSTYTLLVSLVVVSLLAVACGPAKPAPTPVVIKPTQAPTKTQPTVAPTRPKPTEAPTTAPTAIPTTKPVTNMVPFGTAQSISEVSILPSKYQLMPQSGSDKPKTGDEFLVVTLSIENTSKTANFNFDPANLVILDPTGTVVSMVALKSLTNELTTQTLKPGAKIDGVIAYQVPQKEEKWTLEFKGTNNQSLMWSNAG